MGKGLFVLITMIIFCFVVNFVFSLKAFSEVCCILNLKSFIMLNFMVFAARY